LGYLNERDVRIAVTTAIDTGDAIDDILDAAGWPDNAAHRSIETGQTNMERFWVDTTSVIRALRLAEETEAGFVYESKTRQIVFEDRIHRLASPHTVSQATYSDDPAETLRYSHIKQLDPLPNIFNIFEADVQHYSVEALAVLWTLSEDGLDSPAIALGATKDFWALFPNPASDSDGFCVDAWTTPVATTDMLANSAADGGGVNMTADIGIAATKFANSMKISLTNNGAQAAYIIFLQARGTEVKAEDPIGIQSEDITSQGRYGERTYPSRARFIPDAEEAQDWADLMVSMYKDPLPIVHVTLPGDGGAAYINEIIARDISDRVTIEADNDMDLGINEDFFIEAEKHTWTPGGLTQVTYECSPATGFGGFWVIGVSTMGETTRLTY
jgi:hypothetical protein